MQIVDADIECIQQISEIEKNNFATEFYSYSQLMDLYSNPNYKIKIVKENNIFSGYIIIYKNVDFDEIFKICIKKQFRRKGYGSALLSYAKDTCNNKIFLEVRACNQSAINFYLSNGFKINGRRIKYYSGIEDAILLEYIK